MKPTLQDLGCKFQRNSEHDLAQWIPNGDFLDITFVQVKVIQDPTEEVILQKFDNALYQTEEDFKSFIDLFPYISATEATKLRVTTVVALPTVSRNHPALANLTEVTSSKLILFREDLNPKATDTGFMAKNLNTDIMAQSTTMPGGLLSNRLELGDIQQPKEEVLDMYKRVTTRYIGLGSLFPDEKPGDFFQRVIQNLQTIEEVAKHPISMARALHLDSYQVSALNTMNILLKGMYGTGKTCVLKSRQQFM